MNLKTRGMFFCRAAGGEKALKQKLSAFIVLEFCSEIFVSWVHLLLTPDCWSCNEGKANPVRGLPGARWG